MTRKKSPTQQSVETLKTHIPVAQPRTIAATGLEDYAYWWKTLLEEEAPKEKSKEKEREKPPRGRIWA